jgi:hypothetical protein
VAAWWSILTPLLAVLLALLSGSVAVRTPPAWRLTTICWVSRHSEEPGDARERVAAGQATVEGRALPDSIKEGP